MTKVKLFSYCTMLSATQVVKNKAIPVSKHHATKASEESRDRALHIINLSIRWRYVIRIALQLL